MNEQKFRSFEQISKEDNDYMSETFDILRNNIMYKNSQAVDQYKELFKVINFTKIADMLYLVTHYGVVSNAMIEEAANKKNNSNSDIDSDRLVELLRRQIFTNSYLAKYGLTEIDNSFDELYDEPIGLYNRSKWYSVASKMLSGAFKGIQLKIDKLSDKLYYTDADGIRQYIDFFSVSTFSEFLEIAMYTSSIYKYRLDWTESDIKKYVTNLLEDETFSTDTINNDIIQFEDCYVHDGVFIEGRFNDIPRFYINYRVYDVVKNRKVTKEIPEMNEFLLHLSDYDDDTVDVFLSRMSTFLLNNGQLKQNMGVTINVLYGASGENGKSLFLSVLQKIFDMNDITSAGLRDFNNQNYQLPKMCQSLLVVDEDASDLQLDSLAAANIKQFVHGQKMETRSIYEKARSYRPRALVVACTNHMPTSVDKSDGFNRRFSIFTQTSKLVNRRFKRSEDWFATIRSDEAAQYLLELLVIAHLNNMSRGSLLANSARMKEVNEDFIEKNDTAVMYVRNVGLEAIVGKPVKIVRQSYESWCDANGVTALKNKFNTTLESKFPLKNKNVTPKRLTVTDGEILHAGLKVDTVVRAWVHVDEDIHQKYVDKFNANSEEIFEIDLTQNNDDVAKSIVDVLEKENAISGATNDEIKRKIEILMDAETVSRQTDVMSLVKKSLQKQYHSEIITVEKIDPIDFERYLEIAKGKKDLTAALKDPRRQVIIYRQKIED